MHEFVSLCRLQIHIFSRQYYTHSYFAFAVHICCEYNELQPIQIFNQINEHSFYVLEYSKSTFRFVNKLSTIFFLRHGILKLLKQEEKNTCIYLYIFLSFLILDFLFLKDNRERGISLLSVILYPIFKHTQEK